MVHKNFHTDNACSQLIIIIAAIVLLLSVLLLLLLLEVVFVIDISSPQRASADAEMKNPSVENQHLKVLALNPRLGQNTAMHASHAATDFFL